jgi:hypothetical protein
LAESIYTKVSSVNEHKLFGMSMKSCSRDDGWDFPRDRLKSRFIW